MFSTGVDLVTGIPGSGKSFYMVERLLGWILTEKRPVYTNLPLNMRVLRKYLELKGGQECANLIYELTEDRFNSFIAAFGTRQKFIDKAIRDNLSRSEAVKKWELENHGFLEYWIPAGSVIAIDEAHHWYPNPALKNVLKKEPPSLMTFLTMHRHGQYLLVIATQAERQLTTTIKSLCSTRFVVKRWDREPLIAGLSLEFVGFPILRYEKYQGEDDPEKTKPLDVFTRFPKLPY
ncbi:MAG: zonular occludens toxin domain-containing protein, partial [Anaerolineales bacterium]|nr:zonular occludens toxin domain-containing protein [Anaerolineales bacterium]